MHCDRLRQQNVKEQQEYSKISHAFHHLGALLPEYQQHKMNVRSRYHMFHLSLV